MKTRTEIQFKEEIFRTGYHQPILMLGSCFTDNIGKKLQNYLFNVSVNPFGVIYNPLSIKNALDALLQKDAYTRNDLDFHDELWFSFDHYTKFSDPSPEKVLENINAEFAKARSVLNDAGTLILTFGTAFVYTHQEQGRVVNNCHKIPASAFQRKMLSVEEIVSEMAPLLDKLRSAHPKLKILYTVSPVRHTKDGLAENQRSKATLLLAIREIIHSDPKKCGYFPAYEIMTDDLRDYRYYAADLVHPNDQAIDYIWELFRKNCLDKEANEAIDKLEPVLRGLQHRPLHFGTEKYRKFRSQLEDKTRKLKNEYPFLNWDQIPL